MAAPAFVPTRPTDDPRAYRSPPRRPEPWLADRPGEVVDGGQPRAARLGHQGPDQGYALRLANLVRDRVQLSNGENLEDVMAGTVAVGLKRASLFGRAPVVHDLNIALTVWGFLDAEPPAELVELRRSMFAEVRNPHHYVELRAIVDAVPAETLRMTPEAVTAAYRAGWRDLLELAEHPAH